MIKMKKQLGCKIEKLDENIFTLTLTGMTKGKLLTIENALNVYNTAIAQDLLCFIRNSRKTLPLLQD